MQVAFSPARLVGCSLPERSLIALAPGVFFGLTNYLQTLSLASAPAITWIFALPAFILSYGLIAPLLVIGDKILSKARTPAEYSVLLGGALISAVAHLSLIALIITWFRETGPFYTAFPVFLREILMTCTPVWLAIFLATLAVMRQVAGKSAHEAPRLDRISLRVGGKTIFLSPKDIRFVVSEGNYLRVVTEHGSHYVRMALSAMVGLLPPQQFAQVHRSAVVRTSLVLSVQGVNGVYQAALRGGEELPVSRNKVAELRSALA